MNRREENIYARLFTKIPEDAELFDRWLDEREGEKDFRKTEAAAGGDARIDAARLANAFGGYAEEPIAAGQIRLLSKRYTEDPWTPPFVAVLEEWMDGMWLVAPFSPYATPATPGEMATGIPLMGRETLQAWNARTMQDDLLEKSFLCGALAKGTLEEARALFRNQLAGTPLPENFAALRGPALRLSSDPRREHVEESVARLRPLSTAVKALERALAEKEAAAEAWAARLREMAERLALGREELRMAAGTHQAATKSFQAGAGETPLDVEVSPETGMATLTFYGEDGNPSADFDGCGLMGADLEFLGTFGGGSLRVPAAALEGGFRLVDPEGMPVDVRPQE